MPRRGKGSKSQAVRTAKDQAYGEAAVQAEAQSVVPLPQTTAPGTAIQPTAQPLAGTLPSPFRPSERPGEPIGTPAPIQTAPQLTPERASLLPLMLPLLYALTNNPYADPDMKEAVRRLENFVPTRFDDIP